MPVNDDWIRLFALQALLKEPEDSLVLISPAAGFFEGMIFDGVQP